MTQQQEGNGMVHHARQRLIVSQTSTVLTPVLHWLTRPLGRTLVQGLVFVLAFHGWPLAHLGQTARRDVRS